MTNPNNPTAKAVAHLSAPDPPCCYRCNEMVTGFICPNCGAKPSIGKAIQQLREEKMAITSIENLSDAVRQHRCNELHREQYLSSLVRDAADLEIEPPFCVADIDSPCGCKDCKKYEAESMASARASYVPKGGQQVSDCCGASDRDTGDNDSSYADFGLCPVCKDHCTYVDEEE